MSAFDALAISAVALRKESVDRNHVVLVVSRGCWVALRKESVDRNVGVCLYRFTVSRSLSARRAWIEIRVRCLLSELRRRVALRKESVDRNL